ncbi:MAG: peroxiredoxin [Acidobacteria bacterium]|nr:peroxiredoxin [Acidobacteriota bacterium]
MKVEIGNPAPDFELTANTGEKWRLSEQRGNVIALLFYPGDETLVCTRQMCSIREHWEDYLRTKATVIGISPGSPEEHSAFAENHRLPIHLLADEDGSVTEDYCSHWLFPTFFMRAIVIVDAKGIVRTKRSMLRAFRPTDRSVITAIYSARGDDLEERYARIKSNVKSK